ncbi:MAG: DUF3298 domain-containing protein [Bacteroidales bacterium]|nr:DUF3298 domain-containing protein [Bacteroidales bacterium]
MRRWAGCDGWCASAGRSAGSEALVRRLARTILIGCALLMLFACSAPTPMCVRTSIYEYSEEVLLNENPSFLDTYQYSLSLEYPDSIITSDGVQRQALCETVRRELLEAIFGTEDVHAALSGEWNDLIRSGKNAPGADVRSGDDDFVRCAKILQEKRLREARSKWQQARDTLTGDIRFLSVRVCYISGTHNDILSCHYYIKEDEFGSRQTCYERGINYAPDGRHLFEADLFKEGWEESLTELLSESFSSGFKTRDLTPFGPVRPNGNFKFNSGGIIWMYDAGEIAPAKDGILRVSLPWSSLQPLMRE